MERTQYLESEGWDGVCPWWIEARAPSLEQLLAMKLSAWRDDLDISDARRLLQEVKSRREKDEIWQSLELYLVPGDELTAQYAFLNLWESLYGAD